MSKKDNGLEAAKDEIRRAILGVYISERNESKTLSELEERLEQIAKTERFNNARFGNFLIAEFSNLLEEEKRILTFPGRGTNMATNEIAPKIVLEGEAEYIEKFNKAKDALKELSETTIKANGKTVRIGTSPYKTALAESVETLQKEMRKEPINTDTINALSYAISTLLSVYIDLKNNDPGSL